MKVITLEGKSKKGKERVKQYGSEWVIEKEESSKLLVQSVLTNPNMRIERDLRWIMKTDDPNFEIVSKES